MVLGAWRYQRFHVSYLLVSFAVGLLAGLFLGRSFYVAIDAGVLIIIFALMLGGLRSRRWWAVGAMLLAGSISGVMRGSHVESQYQSYGAYVGKTTIVKGVMTGDAQQAGGGRQRLAISRIEMEGRSYPGEVFVTIYGSNELKRGDFVEVSGVVREGFASYGAAISAAKILHIERGPNVIRDIRERFAATIRELLIEPISSLGLGFVVGQRSALPDKLDEQLKIVGLTHIVVASGYNLTILVRFMMRLLSRHSRYLALVSSLIMILLFVLFSGLSPSMNRAVLVTVLGLLAWYVGRRFHPLLLLMYVAAATAVFNPMYIWSDLGWYLSFFAFAGILIVAPLVTAYLYRRRSPSSFEQLVLETLCAEVMALPLIAFAFGTIPVFGLASNVLVAPFIPAAMAFVAAAGVAGMVLHSLAAVLALPAMILIGYMVAVVEWIARLPMAQYEFDLGLWMIVLWYLLVTSICLFARYRTSYDFRRRDERLEV